MAWQEDGAAVSDGATAGTSRAGATQEGGDNGQPKKENRWGPTAAGMEMMAGMEGGGEDGDGADLVAEADPGQIWCEASPQWWRRCGVRGSW